MCEKPPMGQNQLGEMGIKKIALSTFCPKQIFGKVPPIIGPQKL